MIAASLAAVIGIGGAGFLLGRSTGSKVPPAVITPRATPTPGAAADASAAINVLDRAGILALGAAAADSAASGTPMGRDLADVVGKRFDLLLPFGCSGPTAEGRNVPLRWEYDAESSTLRVHVETVTWQPNLLWGENPPADIVSLEGFWIAHPWSSRETCHPVAPAAAPPGMEVVTLPGQTLGIAQIVSATSPRRVLRKDRFNAVLRVDQTNLNVSHGLQLRLTGRIGKFPDGGPTRCIQPAGFEQRPICIVATNLDEVSIVNPNGTAPSATWSVGQDVRAGS